MTAAPILAAYNWRTNAELIADLARLGYLKKKDVVLDPTYGKGTWWNTWSPDQLVTHDIKMDGVDFRDLPEADDTFDAVAFDPPYVSVGGRATSTIPDFLSRYGMATAPSSPAGVQNLIFDGLKEIARVIKPRKYVLVKCQDYVSSGKLWEGTALTRNYAVDKLGFKVVDRIEHIGHTRAQPPGRRQVHARRNLSTMFVFKSPK